MLSKKPVFMIVAVLLASLFLLVPVKASTFPSLPPDPVTLEIQNFTAWPATISLSDVLAGYDVTNSPPTYTGWCAQLLNEIYDNTQYSTMLISSLDLSTPWDKINYLLNNKAGSGEEIQIAIWLLLGFDPASEGITVTTNAQNMYNAANTNGGGFVPAAGQLVAVKCETEGDAQDLFIELEVPGEYEGLSPGFWKHNVRVALGYPGRYSVPHEGELRLDYGEIVGLAETATGETGTAALEAALAALTARGRGSEAVRLAMANAFNDAAGYTPYSD